MVFGGDSRCGTPATCAGAFVRIAVIRASGPGAQPVVAAGNPAVIRTGKPLQAWDRWAPGRVGYPPRQAWDRWMCPSAAEKKKYKRKILKVSFGLCWFISETREVTRGLRDFIQAHCPFPRKATHAVWRTRLAAWGHEAQREGQLSRMGSEEARCRLARASSHPSGSPGGREVRSR